MSRLFKNILYNFFGQGVVVLLGFIAVKYIFSQLGKDVLGVIFFSAMMNMVLTAVSQMGITATLVREISKHHVTDPEYVCQLIRTSSFFYWSIYILLASLIYFLSPLIVGEWITLESLEKESAIFILRVLGVASITALPKTMYASLFRGIQRMEYNNGIDVLTTGLQQVGVISILFFNSKLYLVVYWYASCYFIQILAYIYISARKFSVFALIPGISLKIIQRNIFFTSRMMISTVVSISYMQIDKIILSKLLPISFLGYYSLLYDTVFKAQMVTGAIANAVYPQLSSLHKENNQHDGMMEQYRKLQDLICFGMVPIYGFIIFAFLPIFSYVLNVEIAQKLIAPMIILCLGVFMQSAGVMPHYFTLAVGKPQIPMRLNLYVLIFNLPLTFCLIYYFGFVGAALSLLTSRIIGWIYGVPRICKECLKITQLEWYVHILKIFILAVATYGTAWIIIEFNDSYTVINLSLAYILATGAFFTGTLLLIGPELKKTINSYILIFSKKLSLCIG
jgi:O-antigen/teichoic acid export membrane protein